MKNGRSAQEPAARLGVGDAENNTLNAVQGPPGEFRPY
jgi:hypothetical protein